MATINSVPVDMAWNVYAGDRNAAAFEIVTADDPIDLTGALIEAQARKKATDSAIAISALVTPGALELGRFGVEWDGEEVRDLLAGQEKWEGVWDLQITREGAPLPTTVVRGAWVAIHDVTRVEVAP